MRKYAVVLAVFLAFIISLAQVAAQNLTFHQNDQVVMKTGVSYIWLRSDPSSDCACVVYAVTSPKRVLRILDADPAPDGVQNWWHVTTITKPIKAGWVEENSLLLFAAFVPTPTLVPSATLSATQQPLALTSTFAQIREGIPYILLRNQPSSSAKSVQNIPFSRPTSQSQCLPLGQEGETRTWDGQQWWRLLTGKNSTLYGWVEEKSLTPCNPQAAVQPTVAGSGAPSPTPASYLTPESSTSTQASYQPYENGLMIWRQDTQRVYVVYSLDASQNGNFLQFDFDSYGGFSISTDVPPAGRYKPVNAFGKVWNGETAFDNSVRSLLGWATAPEQGFTTTIASYTTNCVPKCDSHTFVTLPNGQTLDMGEAFFAASIK